MFISLVLIVLMYILYMIVSSDIVNAVVYTDNKITLGISQDVKSFLSHDIITLEFSFIIIFLKFSFTRYR